MTTAVPTVPGSLLLGNLAELRADRIGFLTRVPREYGDIAWIRVGAFKLLLISAPELVQTVLVEQADAFMKGVGLSVFARPLLGDGLLTSEGDKHKRQRRMLAPAFMHKRIASYADTITAFTDRRVSLLADKSEVDLCEELMQLTFEIVGKTLFNADVRGDAREVGDAVTVAITNMAAQLYSALPLPPRFPTPANLRTRRSVRRLDEVVYRLIRERRSEGGDHGDMMSMLLLAQDEADGSAMSDLQVRDEVMTAMLAGHETTANALAWSFYLLARNPEQRTQLEAELDAVLGGRPPTLADLPRLPFALQVFREALRLYPPAYLIARRARGDMVLAGQRLKKGQLVVINIVGMHHRAEYFEQPLTFDPARFSAERERQQKKGAYMPFGGGPRICIGNHFALMEGQLALAHLAQHYRFELVRDAPVEPEALITLRPKGGLPMYVRPRSATSSEQARRASVA
jgi:cytochrome P450